jgi:hypothetical protein
MTAQVIKGVTLETPIVTANAIAQRNMETIVTFFSLYLKDKAAFYALWVDDNPQLITPFVTNDVAVCTVAVHAGWDAVKAFWDPIFDEMTGQFDWFVDEWIPAEDPDLIVTKSHSAIDVMGGATWGNKHIKYGGRYVQMFKFEGGKVKSFEEYYDTAQLNAVYGA